MRGLLSRLLAERERWPLWLPVAFAAGIGGYFALPAEPPVWLGAGAAGLTALGWRLWHRHAPARLWAGEAVAIALLAATLGFAAAQWRTAVVAAPALAEETGPTRLTGRVVAIERLAAGQRVVLDRLRIADLAPDRTPARVRVTLRGGQPAFWPGDWLQFRASLRGPPPPAAPGAFDFQRHSYFQRIGGVGFAYGRAEIVGHAPGFGLAAAETWLARLRHDVTGRILAALPARSGAVAAALMTGERRAIAATDLAAMRDAGLAHLLAISGLHIGLVAGLLFVGLRGLLAVVPAVALRFPIKKHAAAAALAGAFAYSLIAGATVPTQRALIAAAFVLVAVLLDRRGISLRSVAWAACAILALHPEALLGASFQMSFAAATALVAGYEALRERRLARSRRAPPFAALGPLRLPALYVGGVMLTTVIAGLATGPFALYHFNRVADYGVAANLLAVPLTALWVMPWAVVAFALMPLGLASWALVPMAWGIEGVLWAAETVAGWPGAVTLLPAGPAWALPLAALGGLWLCLWRRRWRWAGLAPVAAALLAIAAARPPDVLVDGEARLLAVRDGDGGYVVSDLRRAKFERDVWLRRAGLAVPGGRWPAAGLGAGRRLRCDAAGCVYALHGRRLALAVTADALFDDCGRADAVVALVPIRGPCPAPAGTVDRFDLWRDGAHALWIRPDGIRIDSVAAHRGDRPWVLRRGREE